MGATRMNDLSKVTKALETMMPKGGWSFVDGKVTVHEDGIAHGYKQPTQDDIDAVINKIESDEYKELRKKEYPDIGEQLDAILKGFNQLRMEGTNLPDDLDKVIGEWLSVKKKYPKG